jgi:hypothetical protein
VFFFFFWCACYHVSVSSWNHFSCVSTTSQGEDGARGSSLDVVALRRPPSSTLLELDAELGAVLRPGDVLEALCATSAAASGSGRRLQSKAVAVRCVLAAQAFDGQGPQRASDQRLITRGFTVTCDSALPVSLLLSDVLRRSGCADRVHVARLERLPNLDNGEVQRRGRGLHFWCWSLLCSTWGSL